MRALLSAALLFGFVLTSACKTPGDASGASLTTGTGSEGIGLEDLPKAAINFDTLLNDIVQVAELRNVAEAGWSGIHAYKAEFKLFYRRFLITRRMGEAASLFNGAWFEIDNDEIDEAVKIIEVGGPSNTQRFMGTDYIQVLARIIEYKERGVSRGQFGTAFRLLKDPEDGSVRIAASMDALEALKVAEVLDASYTDGVLTLVYKDQGTFKVTVQVNPTLDVDIYQLKGNQFEHVAYYKGGYKLQPGDPL